MNKQEIIKEYKPNYKVSEEYIRNIDLEEIMYQLNDKYFNYNDWIYETKIKWSGRLTSVAGKGWNKECKNQIKLSTHYFRQFPNIEEIKSVVAHEMVHLEISGHDIEFRTKMYEINNKAEDFEVKVHSKENAKTKYVAVCPNHDVMYCYSRKPKAYGKEHNYYCTKCKENIEFIKIPEN